MSGNINKKTYMTYIICGISACIFITFLFIYDIRTNTRQQQSAYSVTEWTDYEKEPHATRMKLIGTIRVDESVGRILAFYSTHQNIKIYSSAKLIYEYPVKNNNPLSNSAGYCWNFINLPYNTNNLEIEITSPYKVYLNNIPKFYIGNSFSISSYIIDKEIVPFISCIIMLIVGIVFIAYHLSVVRVFSSDGKLLKLGILAVILSVWSSNECPLMALLLKNSLVTSYISFLALMLLPLPFAVFVKTFYEDDGKLWDMFCKADMAQVIICVMLAVLRIADLQESLWSTYAMLGTLVAVIIVQSCINIKNKVHSNMVKIHMACVLVCCVSLALDLADFHLLNTGGGNTFGRLGFLVYIIVLGTASTMETVSLMKMGQEANAYQKLAYTDQMTGLKNRTCFNIDFEKLSKNPTDVAIIDFDLNNLKYANDTFGHAAGDDYIKRCATIIYEIFNGIGSCYRVGGDEFVALVKEYSTLDMKYYMAMLEASVDSSNRESKNRQLKMQIAYGCAVFNPYEDKNLEDTYIRADKIMYDDKKEKKERRKFEKI